MRLRKRSGLFAGYRAEDRRDAHRRYERSGYGVHDARPSLHLSDFKAIADGRTHVIPTSLSFATTEPQAIGIPLSLSLSAYRVRPDG